MARIGILTCSNATRDLGCLSVSCLHDLRKRKGAFARYPSEEKLDLVGIINCSGCPSLAA
ncbi:MAG: CGGC domain-containing protein [Desulfitobacteriaceae bacterium]|nr:CGGC domain-containing protein [Desulfitobacteriaceae bacterium]